MPLLKIKFCCFSFGCFFRDISRFDWRVPATSGHTLAERLKAKASLKDQSASCGPTRDVLHCHRRSQKRWPWNLITSSRWASSGRHCRSTGSQSSRKKACRECSFWQQGGLCYFFYFFCVGPWLQPCCFPVFFPAAGLRLTGTNKAWEKTHPIVTFFTSQKIQMAHLSDGLNAKICQSTFVLFSKGIETINKSQSTEPLHANQCWIKLNHRRIS